MDCLTSCHLYLYQYCCVKILYQNDSTVYHLIYFNIISLFLSQLSSAFITSRFLYSPHPKMGKDFSTGKIALTVCVFSFYISESSVCMNFKVVPKKYVNQ